MARSSNAKADGPDDPQAGRPRRQRGPEARANIAAANRRPEKRARQSASLKGRPGRPHDPETKEKMSADRKGRKHTPEHRANIAAALRRPETVAKMSAAQRGQKRGPEARANIAAANRRPEKRARQSASLKGRKRDPETVAKYSESQRGQKRSPQARANMSAARKGSRYVRRDLADQFEAFLEGRRAARPEPATSPGRSVLIGDREVIVSSEEQVRVIEVLKHEPRPLSLDEIGEKAGVKSPRHVMSKLRKHPVGGPAIMEETGASGRKVYWMVYTR